MNVFGRKWNGVEMWSPGFVFSACGFQGSQVGGGGRVGGGRAERAPPWRQGFATEEVASQYLNESK